MAALAADLGVHTFKSKAADLAVPAGPTQLARKIGGQQQAIAVLVVTGGAGLGAALASEHIRLSVQSTAPRNARRDVGMTARAHFGRRLYAGLLMTGPAVAAQIGVIRR